MASGAGETCLTPIFLGSVDSFEDGVITPVSQFGQHLQIQRLGDKLNVRSNICRHRGMRLLVESAMNCERCPYHGLAPEPFRPAKMFGDLAFSPDSILSFEAATTLRNFAECLGPVFHKVSAKLEAPYYLWIQNTMDVGHIPVVHSGGFSDRFKSPIEVSDVWMDSDCASSSFKLSVASSSITALSDRFEIPRTPLGIEDKFLHVQIGPYLSITSFLGVFFSIEISYPTSKNTSFIETHFFTHRDVKVPRFILEAAKGSNERILLEDREMIEAWWPTYGLGRELKMPHEERIRGYLGYLEGLGCLGLFSRET